MRAPSPDVSETAARPAGKGLEVSVRSLSVFEDSHSFITRAFLQSVFELDYRAYAAEADAELLRPRRELCWNLLTRLRAT